MSSSLQAGGVEVPSDHKSTTQWNLLGLFGERIPEFGSKRNDMLGVTPCVLIHIDDIDLSRAVLKLYSEQTTSNGCCKADGTWVHNSPGYDSENSSMAVILGLRTRMNEVMMMFVFPSGLKPPFIVSWTITMSCEDCLM